ncbi:hypothetical protein SHKM778_36580 [Streptomyces sp. KM77-8]|uniref:Uncharacterized protein n=1 Tax=Streptomyces haneummycinicus TaxID=3074435 RepID=A0AAT9HIY0_9ACTN
MDRVFLVPPVESVDPLPLVEPFLRQAQRAGVRRLVMLGSAIVLPNAPSAVQLAAQVRAQPGGVVLRASGFMQNFLRPHPWPSTSIDSVRFAPQPVTASWGGSTRGTSRPVLPRC